MHRSSFRSAAAFGIRAMTRCPCRDRCIRHSAHGSHRGDHRGDHSADRVRERGHPRRFSRPIRPRFRPSSPVLHPSHRVLKSRMSCAGDTVQILIIPTGGDTRAPARTTVSADSSRTSAGKTDSFSTSRFACRTRRLSLWKSRRSACNRDAPAGAMKKPTEPPGRRSPANQRLPAP